jgi:hypothetical protein
MDMFGLNVQPIFYPGIVVAASNCWSVQQAYAPNIHTPGKMMYISSLEQVLPIRRDGNSPVDGMVKMKNRWNGLLIRKITPNMYTRVDIS